MKARWFIPVSVALIILGAFLLQNPRTTEVGKKEEVSTEVPTPTANGEARTSAPATTSATQTTDTIGTPVPTTIPPRAPSPPENVPTPVGSTVPPQPEGTPPLQAAPSLEEVREAIDNVQFTIRDYRTALGENPIGTNAEITKALSGDNLKQVRLSIPQGSTLNENGEMCDRWGTPYFFHQLSKTQMEIHSAGADRKMWSEDDIVVK